MQNQPNIELFSSIPSLFQKTPSEVDKKNLILICSESIQSDEVSERYAALQILGICQKEIPFAFPDAKQMEEFEATLLELSIADEEWRNRVYATFILSHYIANTQKSKSSPHHNTLAENLLSTLAQLYHKELSAIDNSQVSIPDLLLSQKDLVFSRVMLISSLGAVLSLLPATNSNHQHVDTLYSAILFADSETDCLYLSQVQVIFSLHAFLPFTSRNRQRIEKFLPSIRRVATGQERSKNGKKGMYPEPHTYTHPLLVDEISRFLSVWFPLPQDVLLSQVPQDNCEELQGYAMLRRRLLSQQPTNPSTLENDPTFQEFDPQLIEKLEQGRFHDALQLNAEVSFHLRTDEIRFDNAIYRKVVHLTNHSADTDAFFWLQVSPPQYFQASPGFGVVPPKSSYAISIVFTPQLDDLPRLSAQITGYIRVRNFYGFPLERITLIGFNGPLLRLSVSSIEFGFCPIGESRKQTFSIANIGLTPSNVAISLDFDQDLINIQPSQLTLNVGDHKTIALEYTPLVEGASLAGALHVQGLGGERYNIPIRGIGGQPLRVFDDRIDFGLVNSCVGNSKGTTKILQVQNLDMTHQLPFSFKSTSADVEVEDIIVPPGEIVDVLITIYPQLNGEWNAKLFISAPNTKMAQVFLTAFVGPLVFLPMNKEIYLPCVNPGELRQFSVPMYNKSSHEIEIVLSALQNTGFSYSIHLSGLSKRSEGTETEVVTNLDFLQGKRAKIPALGKVMCEFRFVSNIPGYYRTSLDIRLVSPFQISYSDYTLNVIVVSSAQDKELHPGSFQDYQDCIGLSKAPGIYSDAIQRLLVHDPIEDSSSEIFHDTSSTLMLSPLINALYREHFNVPPKTILTLRNTSSTLPQTYKLVVSAPFRLMRPNQGVIEPNSVLSIPLQLASDVEMGALGFPLTSGKSAIHHGCLSVLDENDQLISSAELFGLNDFVLGIGLKSSELRFPYCKIDERVIFTFKIVNQTDKSIYWQCKLAGGQGGTGTGPFFFDNGLTHCEGTLEEFEAIDLSISFHSQVQGLFCKDLEILAQSPYFTQSSESELNMVFTGTCECFCGDSDIFVDSEDVDFGDVSIGSSRYRSVNLTNTSMQDASVIITTAPPFLLPISHILLPKRRPSSRRTKHASLGNISHVTSEVTEESNDRGQKSLEIIFEPLTYGKFVQTMTIFHNGSTYSIKLRGNAGIFQLNSNWGPPLSEDLEHTIDLGMFELGIARHITFRITNTGSLSIPMNDIRCDSSAISWKILPTNDTFDALSQITGLNDSDLMKKFADPDLEKKELDWDEVMFQRELVMVRKDSESQAKKKALEEGNLIESEFEFVFPFRLQPGSHLDLDIELFSEEVQQIHSHISIYGPDPDYPTKSVTFQPTLEFDTPILDFGVVPVRTSQTLKVPITNHGVTSLLWKAVGEITILGKEEENSNIEIEHAPFDINPCQSSISPGQTQLVNVTFSPVVPHSHVKHILALETFGLGVSKLKITGVGGTAKILLLLPNESPGLLGAIDFGCVKLLSTRSIKFHLINQGEIDAPFHIENSSKRYVVSPPVGVVKCNSKLLMHLSFEPLTERKIDHTIRIFWEGSRPQNLLTLRVTGSGGHPSLEIQQNLIHFGTALLNCKNECSLRIYNNGSAEAMTEVIISNSDLTTDPPSPFFVSPKGHRDVSFVFVPKLLRSLEEIVSIRLVESPQDLFKINVKGSVGVPQIHVSPENALSSLIFGVSMVHQEHKRNFSIANTGSMDLDFDLIFLRPKNISEATLHHFYSWKDHIEYDEIDPGDIIVEPMNGCFIAGGVINFEVIFHPRLRGKSSQALLCIRNRFMNLYADIFGVGGDPLVQLSTPLKTIDFGMCRIGGTYHRSFDIINPTIMPFTFHVEPDPSDMFLNGISVDSYKSLYGSKDMQTYEQSEKSAIKQTVFDWHNQLHELGFHVQHEKKCMPGCASTLNFQFLPNERRLGKQSCSIRIAHSGGFEYIRLSGESACSRLALSSTPLDSEDSKILDTLSVPQSVTPVEEIDFGILAIAKSHIKHMYLVNYGNMDGEFYLSKSVIEDFTISPASGVVRSRDSIRVKIVFTPSSDTEKQANLRLFCGLDKQLNFVVKGKGGLSRLDPEYIDPKDIQLRGLDFELVAIKTCTEKQFYVHNRGRVAASVKMTSNSPYYFVSILGNPHATLPNGKGARFAHSEVSNGREMSSFCLCKIPAAHFVIVRVILRPDQERLYPGLLHVESQHSSFDVVMRARGGTVIIKHTGDLDFGHIACNHVYTRKITIFNLGSIPAVCRFYWKLEGRNAEFNGQHKSSILLQGFSTKRGPKIFWKMAIRWSLMVVKINKERQALSSLPKILTRVGKTGFGFSKQTKKKSEIFYAIITLVPPYYCYSDSLKPKISQNHPMYSATVALNEKGVQIESRIKEIMRKYKEVLQEEAEIDLDGKMSRPASRKKEEEYPPLEVEEKWPHISITPDNAVLSKSNKLTVTVSINLHHENPFKGHLVCAADLGGQEPYLIPMSADPTEVSIAIDNYKTLNFGKIPIGEQAVILRHFTNLGTIQIRYRFHHDNLGLTIFPHEGRILANSTIRIEFTFRPIVEALQVKPIFMETNCTPPLTLNVYAGGGVPKLVLENFDKFDFGRCMIGKSVPKLLEIRNEGTAKLPITNFKLEGSSVFQKGENWPTEIVQINPSGAYNLPLLFNPPHEQPFSGKLTIVTHLKNYTIDLVGTGREAVLSLTKQKIEILNAIVGNVYRVDFEVLNAGDLTYPLSLDIISPPGSNDDCLSDLTIHPKSMRIPSFDKEKAIITYRPRKDTDAIVLVILQSIYSYHELPITITSGTAEISILPDTIDFGTFEPGNAPKPKLTISNQGTMAFVFRIQSQASNAYSTNGTSSTVKLSRWEGKLTPGTSCEIVFTYVGTSLGQFCEEFLVETERIGDTHFITVSGVCDSPVVHHEQFKTVDLEQCLVGTPVKKSFTIENFGGFPLEASLHYNYPIRVQPSIMTIPAYSKEEVVVQWTATGSYRLRSTIKMTTNIGEYDIEVVGTGAFPLFKIDRGIVDFGVCALNRTYSSDFTIINIGHVQVLWSIPALLDGFQVSQDYGSIPPRQSSTIQVKFTPQRLGNYTGNLIVESRGRYRIVTVTGNGGKMRLSLPETIDFASHPCGQLIWKTFRLVNTGHVPLNLKLSTKWLQHPIHTNQELPYVKPDHIDALMPKKRVMIQLGVHLSNSKAASGGFKGSLIICDHHDDTFKEWRVGFIGKGTWISLPPSLQRKLDRERLSCQNIPLPLGFRQTKLSPEEQDSESAIQAAVFTLMDSALSQIISPQENDFHLRQNPQNHLHSEEYKELELLQNLDPEEVIQVVDTLLYHPLLPNTSLRHLLKIKEPNFTDPAEKICELPIP